MELADYVVVEPLGVWHSTEGRMYPKGSIIKLPANLKVTADSSVQRVAEPEDETRRRGRPPKATE